MSVEGYYEIISKIDPEKEEKDMENMILTRKQVICIKSYRVLSAIAKYFKSIGYYQGFHYISIFLAKLDYSEKVEF